MVLYADSVRKRFWKHVRKTRGCWLWTGIIDAKGYGRLVVNRDGTKRPEKAARVAWFVATGKWPTKHVLHSCDNPPCVRWKHLREGTNAENHLEKILKGHAAKKLTAAKVRTIRRLYKARKLLQRELAVKFGVSKTMIRHVISRRYWSHVS